METNREQAKKAIEKLVEQFTEQYASYHKNTYDEATLRIDFINKFFKALGWDVDNVDGLAEDYREVIYEDKLKIGKSTKAPDYGFRLSGSEKRLFFVEAKKPAVPIKTDKGAAYQLRRYGRSAQTAVSILTNFEQLAVYDCSKTPSENDSAAVNRIKYLKYEDYVAEFDFIYDTFSREAVVKGRFDKFVQSDTNKRGSVPLDKEFVEVLNNWRKDLAVSIAKNNVQLSEEQLNFAVQQTIDRLIFLRFCEDRAVEHYGNLKNTTAKGDTYQNLLSVFNDADKKYNSGLFDFEKDTITKNLKIDNKVIKGIVLELYYPKCEYEFSVLPVEILGNAYEQFLGKVIRITTAHSAKIDDKPEVRKAGGVYYTPQYIVDYIVEHTVGELVKGKSPKEIEKIKIVDPACGSGSFLLGAFKYLLKHYTEWFIANGYMDKKNGGGKLTPGGRLVTAEKRKILLTHIYGVDLDSNAVEVSKLSLLLKSMEGETEASINQQLTLHHERILPDLDKNIVCGNSLIGHDFFDGGLGFEGHELEELRNKIKPFDWKIAFPQVFRQGGFDAVIGNPPYIRVQLLNESAESLDYFANTYRSALSGNYDIYVLFIEKALSILKKSGFTGYILPHKFFNSKYGVQIRRVISSGQHLNKIVHFGDKQIFSGATTYTCLLFLSKNPNEKIAFSYVSDIELWRVEKSEKSGIIDAKTIDEAEWNFTVGGDQKLFQKLSSIKTRLGDIAKIFVGLQTSADTVFLFKNATKSTSVTTTVFSKELNEEVEIENALLKNVVRSGQIGRYWLQNSALILFPYRLDAGAATLLPEETLRAKYPLTWSYLLRNKKLLEGREHGKFKRTGWYQLYPKNLDMWEREKIMVPYMIKELSAYPDKNNNYFVNVTTGGFGLIIDREYSSLFITGLLNSKVLDWYLKKVSTNFNSGYFAANKQFLVQLPIINCKDKNLHDKVVQHVESMLKLKMEFLTMNTPAAKQQLENRIAYTDKKIDELVYELYGLNEEEIGIIEGTIT